MEFSRQEYCSLLAFPSPGDLPDPGIPCLLCFCRQILFFFFFFNLFLISWRLITLQYCSGFCHTLTWISLGYTCIPAGRFLITEPPGKPFSRLLHYNRFLSWSIFIFYFFLCIILFFFPFIFISWRLITLQYCSGFCHTLTWINHEFTCVPHPESPFHLPPHPIPLGYPSAPAPSSCLLHPAWAGGLFHTW